MIGRAFQNDPFMVYLVPDPAKRKRFLPDLFRIMLRYCSRYGTVYTTADLAGAACCLPPGQTNPTIARLMGASMRSMPILFNLARLRRFLQVTEITDREHIQTIPGEHWYLWVLGVEPQKQGQGIGSKLLQTVLQQARTQNLPCYLETENPRNVPFYQSHGFRLVSETVVKGSELRVYAMLWEPEPV